MRGLVEARSDRPAFSILVGRGVYSNIRLDDKRQCPLRFFHTFLDVDFLTAATLLLPLRTGSTKLPYRQRDRKTASGPKLTVYFDIPPVLLNNVVGSDQARPHLNP